jgi:hypothetical protein
VNYPDLTSGKFVFILLMALAMMVAYPFVKAFLIYIATRVMKFKKLSYWKSFFCVLIGIGIMMVIQTIFLSLSLRPGHEFNPNTIMVSNTIAMLLSLFLVPIAEATSMYLFFREPIGKILLGLVLTYLFVIALLIVLLIMFIASLLLI